MTARRSAIIANKFGLHARAAVVLSDTANKFESQVRLTVASKTADAKSILDLLTLAATPGTEVLIEAIGNDAEDAVIALEELIREKFQEE